MKRLLAYLFIVLGLGLTFNSKSSSAENNVYYCESSWNDSLYITRKINKYCKKQYNQSQFIQNYLKQKINYVNNNPTISKNNYKTVLKNQLSNLYAQFDTYKLDKKKINLVVNKSNELEIYQNLIKNYINESEKLTKTKSNINNKQSINLIFCKNMYGSSRVFLKKDFSECPNWAKDEINYFEWLSLDDNQINNLCFGNSLSFKLLLTRNDCESFSRLKIFNKGEKFYFIDNVDKKLSEKNIYAKKPSLENFLYKAYQINNSLYFSTVYGTSTNLKDEYVLFLDKNKCLFGGKINSIIKNFNYKGSYQTPCEWKSRNNDREITFTVGKGSIKHVYTIYYDQNILKAKQEKPYRYGQGLAVNEIKKNEILNLAKKYNIQNLVSKISNTKTKTQIAKKEPSQTQKVVETVSLKLNKNEVDAIFSSVNSCWSIPLGLPYNQDLSVKIKVKFDPSGNAIRTEIIDFAKINKKGNAYLKVLAESALRAIKLCSPIRAPKDKYDLWKEVVFNFDAKDVLNGTESKDTTIAKNNLLKKYTETQIAKAEPTAKPKKKVKVAKVEEPKQEEFKPENKDNEAPIIEIAEAITVNDSTYEIEGKVIDKSKKLFVQIDGETIPVKKGKFKIKRFSPVDEQLNIVALDQWGNKSKPKLVNITIDLKETELAEKLEQLNPSLIKSKSNKDRVALIIGIEKYEQTPAANFANLDAQYFYEYARKGFGISKSNIKLLVDEDADLVKSISSINKWLPSKIKKNKTELIIFFAGHGLASNNGQELYILPQDSDPDLLSRTALSRTELFEQIISLSPKSVTMFMDTCYSGISRDEKMLLASARPIRIIADDQDGIPNNFTIFSASKLDQISSGLKEAKHGIFSYYLMKGLEGKADINQDNKITNGELLAYMDQNVSQKASELGRQQNPSLAGDPNKVLMSYR